MAMEMEYESRSGVGLVTLRGRLGAFEAARFEAELPAEARGLHALCLDLSEVDYISSAGIRVLLKELRRLKRPERLALVNPCEYVREVLRVAGVERLFRIWADADEAVRALQGAVAGCSRGEDSAESTPAGDFLWRKGSEARAALSVLGRMGDVLRAQVTPEMLALKRFSEAEYSIGLGAMGGSEDDCAPFLGEMMTVGGTVMWLPTDGNDTPDFLIPRSDSDLVGIRAAFSVSLLGDFNEYASFRASGARGATLDEVYAEVFARARRVDGEWRGVAGLVMWAQISEMYAGGLRLAPIRDFAPADGEMITSPNHAPRWLEADAGPRGRDVTGLIVGFGADLEADLGGFDRADLDAALCLDAANVSGRTRLLHNHGAAFAAMSDPPEAAGLEDVIARTVEQGSFCDMRHVRDTTRVRRALMGVWRISEIRRERPA